MTNFLIGSRLPVRRIGLGTMRLTDAPGHKPTEAPIWTAPTDAENATSVLRTAVDLGVNLIDTADSYALGDSETFIADALHPYREGLVLATKVGVARPSPTEWVPLGRPEYLRQQAELSLRRLKVERLDLLQLHRVDPAVPFEDQIGALKQLVDEGKAAHIGLSEVGVEELERARAITPIASVQNWYNLSHRDHEAVVDYAEANGIAFIPFFPIAAGAATADEGPIAEIATELGASKAQVALAWLLKRSPAIVPIPGTRDVRHLADNVGALEVELTDGQFERLSAPVPAGV